MRYRAVRLGLWLMVLVVVVPGTLSAQDVRASRIVGRVLDADDDRPVVGVTVSLVDLGRLTTSDDRGRCAFDSVPAGDHRFRVRHLGYESSSRVVSVAPLRSTGVSIHVSRKPVEAEDLRVTVQTEPRIPNLEDEGFYRRREKGFGHFYGPQYRTAWRATRVGDTVGRTPGLRIRRVRGRYRVDNVRCPHTGGGMPVAVDGQAWGPDALSMPTTAVRGVEVYRGPSSMVGVAYPASRCGAIFVWTWRGPNPFVGDSIRRLQCPERLRELRPHAC